MPTTDDSIYDDTIEGSNKSDLIGWNGVWTWSSSQQRYVELIPGQAGTDQGGADADDLVLGGNGNDEIFGGRGSDRIDGQNGNDVLWGDRQATITNAGVTSTTDYEGSDAGDDVLTGGNGEDELHGGAGDDVLWGGAAGDESTNTTENGRDVLYGDAGNDLLHGGNGKDVLDGGANNDQLFGDNGSDVLLGGDGDDSLVGGLGADTLEGGAGYDRYVYNSVAESPAGGEYDVIESFASGAAVVFGDKIDLTGIVPVAGSFVWRGDAGAATGANAVWFTQVDGGVMLKADSDADGVEDLQVFVKGVQTLKSSDVIVGDSADTPTLSVADASSAGDGAIVLNIAASLIDTDGSEGLAITVSGVPGGWTLSPGQLVDEDSGTYALTPSQLTGLSITPPVGTAGDVQLTVTATATELGSGDSASTSATLTVSVTQADVIQGQAIDGYIANGTVFADANDNGEWDDAESFTDANSNGVWDVGEAFVDADGDAVWDAAEAKATTDASGNFTLVDASGPLVMYGGTDVSTGLAFDGVLRAPEGSTVVTPLTTLVAAVMDQNPGMLLETATMNVTTSLGLDELMIGGEPIDILTLDPVAVAVAGGADADAAAEVLAAGIQVQNTIVQVGALLTGAGATNGTDAVIAALAGLVAYGTTIDLTDDATDGTLETLIEQAASEATGIAPEDIDVVTGVAVAVLSAANTEIETALAGSESGAALLEHLAQVAVVAQSEELSEELALAGSQNDSYAGSVATDYTGSNLEGQIAGAEVGDVDGGQTGTIGNDLVIGGPGNDAISGGAGNDQLIGLAGNDTLFGGSGNDTLQGGLGNDVLNGGVLSKYITPAEFYDTDFANYAYAAGPVNVNLATGVALAGVDDTDTLIGFEGVIGSAFADRLTGSAAFAETFVGGAGNDTIDGSLGFDRADYSAATGPIEVRLGSGNASAPNALGTVVGDISVGTDSLVGVETLRGTQFFDTYIAAGFSSLSLSGGFSSSFNEFEGLGGDDVIIGNGNTRASYWNAPGPVTVVFVGETPTVGGSSGTATGAGSGTDTLSGISQVRGSAFADVIHGGPAVSTQNFEGRGGNDTIYGGNGFDISRHAFDGPISVGITVNMAAGTVEGDPIYTGNDTLRDVEGVQGSILDDEYDATDYGVEGALNVSSSSGTFNQFEGMAGNDTIIGNGNTRIAYGGALEGVTVNMATGITTGGPSVGTDTFSGVNSVQGSNFNDIFTVGRVNATLDGIGGDDLLDFSHVTQGINFTLNRSVFSPTVSVPWSGSETYAYTYMNMEGVIGTPSNDIITGSHLLDTLVGGLGADTIDGGADLDLVSYSYADSPVRVSLGLTQYAGVVYPVTANLGMVTGDGSDVDTLISIERVTGSNYDDVLVGGTFGYEAFQGLAGNDTIVGGASGARDALYYLSPSAVVVNLAAGTASDGFGTTDTLVNINWISGSRFADHLIGDANNNVLRGFDGADTLNGGGGIDESDYRRAGQGVIANLSDAPVTWALDGVTRTVLHETAFDGFMGGSIDTLISIEDLRGSPFADYLVGSSGDNRLRGEGGNDTLIGGDGNDTLEGGDGDDTMVGGSGADSIIGGAGLDLVDYEYAGSAVRVSLGLASYTVDGNSQAVIANTGEVTGDQNDIDTLNNIERVTGSNYNDVLVGGTTNFGYEGFQGLAGNDTMVGGASGAREAVYLLSPSGVVVNLATGQASDGWGGADTLINLNWIMGSQFPDHLIGNSLNNVLRGRGGADTLDGGGGSGIDEADYRFNSQPAVVNLSDAVITVMVDGVSRTVQPNTAFDGYGDGSIDSLISIENVRGGDLGDYLVGSSGPNLLRGEGGNDTLRGGGGNDSIDGGAGFNILDFSDATGGIFFEFQQGTASDGGYHQAWISEQLGSDSYRNMHGVIGSDFGDTLRGSAFSDYISGNGGDDRFWGFEGNDTIYGGDGNDVFESAEPEDSVRGAGDDLYYGGAGDDVIRGGPGDDTYDGGEGADRATYYASPAGVSVDLSLGQATGDGWGGSDTLISIENLSGSLYNDTLSGDDGDNVLFGNAGDDLLDGRSGSDTAYYFASGAVQVDLGAGTSSGADGNDTLVDIENVGGSSYGDELIGDPGGNLLSGFDGNDWLEGGDGDDLLLGGDGDDTLFGGAGNDTLDGGIGVDQVSYAMAAGAVSVNLSTGIVSDGDGGTDQLLSIEHIIGSAHDDTLTGGSDFVQNLLEGGGGNDSLVAGAGNDILIGGQGNDILTGGSGADRFTWGVDDHGTSTVPDVDVITDFDPMGSNNTPGSSDELMLKDLLVGENHSNLDQYLHFDFTSNPGNTTIEVRTEGPISTDVDLKIVLQGFDATAGGQFNNDNEIIRSLLDNWKLYAG